MFVENKILSKLLRDNKVINILKERNVTEELFYDKDIKRLIKQIFKFYKKYGKIPSIELVKTRFDIKLEKTKDPIEYYIDELIKNYTSNKSKQILLNIAPNIDEDPLETIERLKKEISQLEIYTDKNKLLDMHSSINDRVKDYFRRKKVEGIDGYLTPFPELTEITGGIHKKDLWAVMALTSVGKTWLLCLFANELLKQGIRTLIATEEMDNHQIARRCDAIEFRLNYEKFRRGLLNRFQEQRYLRGMKEAKSDKRFKYLKISESNNLSDLQAEVKENKIQVLMIDGGYLLDENSGRSLTENVTNISRKLKRFTKKLDVAGIVTWQFAKSSKKDGSPALEHAGWAYAISQDSTNALGLQRIGNMEEDKKRNLVLMKNREGKLDNWIINYDLDEMDFSVDEEATKEDHVGMDDEKDVEY